MNINKLKEWGKLRHIWISTGAIILIIFMFLTNILKFVDSEIQDKVFMSKLSLFKMERSISDKILIVGIDETSTQTLGRWPWDRKITAEGIKKLSEGGAAVIGLDMIISDYSDENSDAELVKAVEEAGNVVVPSYGTLYENSDGSYYGADLVTPFKELRDVSINAHINTYPENKIIRQTINEIQTDEGPIRSFAIELYNRYVIDLGLDNNIEHFISHEDKASKVYFDYPCERDDFQYMSFSDLLNEEFPQDYFKDTIVLIGPYDEGMQDSYFTPLDKNQATYGVNIWATVVQNLLNNISMQTSKKLDFSFIIILGIIAGVISSRLKPAKGALGIVGINIIYIILAQALYSKGIRISLAYGIFLTILIYLALLAYKYLVEYSERKRVTNIFGKYVAPQVVDKILDEGEEGLQLGGSKRFITVLFVDIRGFTPMSEKATPEQVVEILNEYLNLCATSIVNNEGTLDKFIGDATMAIFNAPIELEDHALKAVKTALAMKEGSLVLEKKLQERFGRTVKFGIGINTGYAVVGNIGCKFRMDYTAIGDTVNTSARLESNAKGGQILISESTYALVKDKVNVTPLGGIKVKGKEEEVQIYQVEGLI